jgi:hypothetical protein
VAPSLNTPAPTTFFFIFINSRTLLIYFITFLLPETGRVPPDISFGAYDELGRKIFYQPADQNLSNEDDIEDTSSALFLSRLSAAKRSGRLIFIRFMLKV